MVRHLVAVSFALAVVVVAVILGVTTVMHGVGV
jgi:hypothetical protein